MKLQGKFALFNVLSKIAFVILFLLSMPFMLERINIIQTDIDLIEKRERILDIIEEHGVQPFMEAQENSFGSYNILKEEFISLEPADLDEYWNFIEVTIRILEDEAIDYRVLNYSFFVDGQMYLLEIGKSLSSIRQTEKNIRWMALALLLAFIAVTVVADISYIRLLLKPLNQLVLNKLVNIHDPGKYSPAPVQTTTEDFKKLDRSINQMMERIQTLFRKEREFTSNVSHELLTPVSILQSKLENLLNEKTLSEEGLVKIGESLKTLNRLKSIINSLLLIARIENEQYLKNEEVPVFELMKEVIGELKEQFEASEIELKVEHDREIVIQKANRALLFTMFLNIFGNTLKYTNTAGKVSVNAAKENGRNIIRVHNTGEGIDPKNLEEIFSRFKKFSSENIQGYGLGLPIAKTIAEFHGINLTAESLAGEGTSFILRI